MSALGSILAAWGPELELLGEGARDLVGPWLPRLDRGLGVASRGEAAPEGEPDGLAGSAGDAWVARTTPRRERARE